MALCWFLLARGCLDTRKPADASTEARRLLHGYHSLIGLEVGTCRVGWRRHSHPLALAGDWLRCAQVREDNVTVEALLVNVFRRWVEIRATTLNTFPGT